MARQNYAIEVEVNSEDEMGRLARTFNNMCASIRQAREDLIRQERISTIGRLSGSIVHDLRNPLAAIYGGAEMLVDADLPPAHVKRLAGNIYRASRRIQELLQDLLNVSRGKTRRAGNLPPARSGLGGVRFAGRHGRRAGRGHRAGDSRRNRGAAGAQPHGAGLRQPRRQRAGGHAGGRRWCACRRALENGAALVQVADNGPGIAAEIRSQLFQPFVSAGKRNGLGLGLALTRQTVLEHGGDMWVESEPGRGARFVIRLPGAHAALWAGQVV